MITPKQSVDLAAAIYNPVDRSKFDDILEIAGIGIGIKEHDYFISFSLPGSQCTLDFLRDGRTITQHIKNIGRVPNGFMEGIDEAFEALFHYLNSGYRLSFNGHSLGASHAAILARMALNAGLKVDSLHLFAPPLTSDAEFVSYMMSAIPDLKAWRNGRDLIPTFPILEDLSQFPLIFLNEAPEEMVIDPIRWHMINLYQRGIYKLETPHD